MITAAQTRPSRPEDKSRSSQPSSHIALGEVFEFRREHGYVAPEHRKPEPTLSSDCLVVSQSAIQPFHLNVSPRVNGAFWAAFENIQASAPSPSGERKAHTGAYSYQDVFSPHKLLVAERDRPVRAVLTSEPVYPLRAKLGILRPSASLSLAYAAVAVLNSHFGQSAYAARAQVRTGKAASPDGLHLESLMRVPVARRDYEYGELFEVGDLVHQMMMLWDAQDECIPLLSGIWRHSRDRSYEAAKYFRQVFSDRRAEVSARLNDKLRQLLGYSEGEEASVLSGVDTGTTKGRQMLLIEPWEALPPPPAPPPVRILQLEDNALLEGDEPEAGERSNRELWSVLPALRYWEENVNARPARNAWRQDCRELAA